MKTLLTNLAGILALGAALSLGGCSGIHNQPGYVEYTEIIYVPVPMPYPDPIVIDDTPPPPVRPRPLPRPQELNEGPRIKRPPADRTPRKPVVVGRGGSERPREQVAVHKPRPVRKR